jgi:serine/threonine-protein kinase
MKSIHLQGKNGSYTFNPRNPQSRIADGGMGVVYLGEQVETNQKVAIKVIYRELAQDERNIERARREAAINVEHPNLIKMLDFIEKDGIYHIVSEYLEGQNLEEFIKQNPKVSTEYAVRVINDVLNGLEALHTHNPPVIHRDIKPSNIFLCYDGSVKLMDFGIARITGGERKSLTGLGTVVGSPHYSPPEQVRGEIDKINETTDIYALGITFYELLTGNPPFDATNEFDILKKQVDEPLPENGEIDKKLFDILKKATEKKQDARHQSIGLLKKELLILSITVNEKKGIKKNENELNDAKPITVIKKNRGWKFIGVFLIVLFLGEYYAFDYFQRNPSEIEDFAYDNFEWYRSEVIKKLKLQNQNNELSKQIEKLRNDVTFIKSYNRISTFSSKLMGSWYTNTTNSWNVFIEYSNSNVIIRTGNKFYKVIESYENKDYQNLYKYVTQKDNKYYSVDIKIESTNHILFSISKPFVTIQEAREFVPINFTGHHR